MKWDDPNNPPPWWEIAAGWTIALVLVGLALYFVTEDVR